MSRKSAQRECPAQARVSSGGCGVVCGVLGGCVGFWVGVLPCVVLCGVLVCVVVGCFVWSCCGVLRVGCGGLLCWVVCWIVVSLNANAWTTLIEKEEQTMYAKIVLLHSGSWVLSGF